MTLAPNVVFLATTVATSLTGYLLPAATILPSHIVGAVSLVVLAVAIYALYGRRLVRHWRSAYVIAAMTALYLNLFVGVVQAFLRVPPLTALAPTQSEPPFVVAQGALFLLFLAVTALCVVRFREALLTGSARTVPS
jgi:uncharacterized membrane-anchored protein